MAAKKKTAKQQWLFVWSDFSPGEIDGLAFALAPDIATAKRLVITKLGYNPGSWGVCAQLSLDNRVAYAVDGDMF